MAKEVNKTNKEKKNKKDVSKKDNNKKSFFKEFKAELKRVSWPTFKQLVNSTTAVITIVLVISAIVFVLDVIFETLNTYGVGKLKALVTSSSSETVEVEDGVVEGNVVSSEAETTTDAEATTEDANAVTNEEATQNVVESSVE